MRLFLIFLLFIQQSIAQSYLSRTNDTDSVYVDFEQLEELTSKIIYGDKDFLDNEKIQEYINIDKTLLPQYSEEEFRRQMSLIPTTIPLTYNKEVGTIIKYFLFNKREYVTRMLTHSQYFFPIFEEKLDLRNVPQEIKVLPIVESALNPLAKSRVGATGLWQIMLGTSKTLNLNTNTLVDERSDPDLSTDAAISYLVKLHSLYNDWLLALAAYNSGPGRVNRALRDAGNVYDFWRVKRFLPKETQNYVPSFIAMVYIMHYHKNYHLFPAKTKINLHQVSKQRLNNQVSLKYIAEQISTDEELLKYLNPSLKKGIVPMTENGFEVCIPSNKENDFLTKINNFSNDPYLTKNNYCEVPLAETSDSEAEILESPLYKIIQQKAYHKVRRGENLQSIARKYNASVNELRKWNRMGRKEKLQAGEKLTVYKDVKIPIAKKESNITPKAVESKAPEIVETEPSNPVVEDKYASIRKELVLDEKKPVKNSRVKNSPEAVSYHKVQSGESLISIAKEFHCTVSDLKAWNNLSSNKIKKGQKLKINIKEVASDSPKKSKIKSNTTYTYYTVKDGDTFWRIASQFDNVSVKDIYRINNLDEDAKIKSGDRIKIPLNESQLN